MTRTDVIQWSKAHGFTHLKTSRGVVALDDWHSDRSETYDGYRVMGAEIIVDDMASSRWGGNWPLLSRTEKGEPLPGKGGVGRSKPQAPAK